LNSPQHILSVKDLRISFDGPPPFQAVSGISFAIEQGKTLAVVGESGSGKSLTALALMGLLPAKARVHGTCNLQTSEGLISLNLLDEKKWSGLRGKHISMVFQEPMSALNPVMKIGKQLTENILAHEPIGRSKAREKALQWMREVQLPTPEKLYERYPHQLSGGQKQRVMIAMAMCQHPALLIADEPTTALDVTVQKEVLLLMRKLQQQYHTSMIFITHDLALAADMADDVLVLYKGQVMEHGPATSVLSAPQHPYTKALLACRPAAQEKGKRLPVIADFLQEKERVVPQPAAMVPPHTVSDENLLQVRDLRIWFGEDRNLLGTPTHFFKAVDEVSFDLKRGEILGLVGESGCGKSTLSRSLMGLIPVRSGQLLFNGTDLAGLAPAQWKVVRKDIQMIFQDPFSSLNPRMTVSAMLEEPLRVHNIVPASGVTQEATRLLNLVQLPASALKRYPHQFSGGQRQRLGIARALTLRPRLLICDESVSALDVSVQAQILNLLKDLQASFDLSYLFISHDLNVVHYISDRVLVMQAGKIVESGSADQILRHPTHPYTQQLVQSIP
jgi:peptide/nickel transport system ATP-binding protein